TNTGLELGDVKTTLAEGILKIVPDFVATGNSPFLGSVSATLKNSSNQTIAEQQQTVALYFSGKRALEIPLPDNLPSGEYQVELRYETKRSDIPSTDLVQAPSITKTVTVQIP